MENKNGFENSYSKFYEYQRVANNMDTFVYQPKPKKRLGKFVLFIGMLLILAGIVAYIMPLFVRNNQTGVGENEGSWGFSVQPSDPYIRNQYALDRINAQTAWQTTTGSSEIIVAVLDTGIDAEHPELKDRLVDGYDFVNNDSTPEDMVGHGTFVSSIIAADGNNEEGITGLAPSVKIMPLKVMDRRGSGSNSAIARAIRYAADNGAKVINLSLGSPYSSTSVRNAITYAVDKGVVVVAASGNEARERNPVNYPAAYSNVISVGATGSNNRVASFSTYNQAVDLVAPGVSILGARSGTNTMCRPYNGTAYCASSGTSFSAPYVAAAAALVLSVNPKLSPAQVQAVLEETATDLGEEGKDVYYGAGLLDVAKAVERAKTI
jgi:type VII secretion-associated serine protease mycosin